MAANCVDCAEPLPLTRRLLGKDRCKTCEQEHAEELKRQREQQEAEYNAAVAEYREVVEQLEPGADLQVIAGRIKEAMRITPLASTEVERLNSEALTGFIARAREDGVISPGEDQFMSQAVQLLGLRLTPGQYRDYMVAALESGLVIRDPQPQIGVPNPDEVPHWHVPAELLEQQVETELQWTSVAPSVPVGEGGVRAQFEAGRGKFVETGRTVRVADRGVLSVTSQRTVFSGNASTFEYPHQRLLGVRLFSDGVGLQIVNRQQMPTFRTGPMVNEITAAVALTAAQRSKGTLVHKPWTAIEPTPVPAVPNLLARAGYRDPGSELKTSARDVQQVALPAAESAVQGERPMRLLELAPERSWAPASIADPELARLVAELDRSIAMRVKVEEVKLLARGLPGTEAFRKQREQLKPQVARLADRLGQIADAAGLPAALRPSPELHRGERPSDREANVPDEIEAVLIHVGALGLTPLQVRDLADDFALGECSKEQLERVTSLLENDERKEQLDKLDLTPTGDSEMDLLFRALYMAPMSEALLAESLVAARFSAGSDRAGRVKEALRQGIESARKLAETGGFPPALTPCLPAEEAPSEVPVAREVPPALDPALFRLGVLGLRPEQIRAVRDDYRRGRCTGEQLERIADVLASSTDSAPPAQP